MSIVEFWKQDLPFEEKVKLYYEKVPHIIDGDGGYRPMISDEYRKETFVYFTDDGHLEIFDDYTLDSNKVLERIDGTRSPTPRKQHGYFFVDVSKNRKQHGRRLCRAMLSTFLGPPPNMSYTVDHIESKRKLDDDLSNLRWLNKSGQMKNRNMPETIKSARIIVNELFPGDELTAKEWTQLLMKPDGMKYKHCTFLNWAQNKENGFSYKYYDDLDDEEWKLVGDPDKNHVEISNKCRIKDVTFSEFGREEHVLTAEQLCLQGVYPKKKINGEDRLVHVLVFQLWYPEEWVNKKPTEMVLHKHDDPLDFRPENLRLGTPSNNGTDAHDNGKFYGKQTARRPCIAYDEDVEIYKFKSLSDAARYLVKNIIDLKFNTAISDIRNALNKDKEYQGFTWKTV
jgi:hypothetical protein